MRLFQRKLASGTVVAKYCRLDIVGPEYYELTIDGFDTAGEHMVEHLVVDAKKFNNTAVGVVVRRAK